MFSPLVEKINQLIYCAIVTVFFMRLTSFPAFFNGTIVRFYPILQAVTINYLQ